MRQRGFLLFVVSVVAGLIGPVASANDNDLGVVLMHGKQGSPSGHIARLASSFQTKGLLVATPAMPWAGDRMYDATFDEAMREIDREIDFLRRKGAKWVVVAGHSMGANAALGYAASREGLSGVIALAPGHTPEGLAGIKLLREDVKRAKELIATGKGKEKYRFTDVNQGQTFAVVTTPEIYLSWFDPEGPAIMPKSAASFKTPTPLLLIVGSRERMARGRDYIFERAPPHPKSKFVTVPADHLEVPTAAIDEVVTWLASLRQ